MTVHVLKYTQIVWAYFILDATAIVAGVQLLDLAGRDRDAAGYQVEEQSSDVHAVYRPVNFTRPVDPAASPSRLGLFVSQPSDHPAPQQSPPPKPRYGLVFGRSPLTKKRRGVNPEALSLFTKADKGRQKDVFEKYRHREYAKRPIPLNSDRYLPPQFVHFKNEIDKETEQTHLRGIKMSADAVHAPTVVYRNPAFRKRKSQKNGYSDNSPIPSSDEPFRKPYYDYPDPESSYDKATSFQRYSSMPGGDGASSGGGAGGSGGGGGAEPYLPFNFESSDVTFPPYPPYPGGESDSSYHAPRSESEARNPPYSFPSSSYDFASSHHGSGADNGPSPYPFPKSGKFSLKEDDELENDYAPEDYPPLPTKKPPRKFADTEDFRHQLDDAEDVIRPKPKRRRNRWGRPYGEPSEVPISVARNQNNYEDDEEFDANFDTPSVDPFNKDDDEKESEEEEDTVPAPKGRLRLPSRQQQKRVPAAHRKRCKKKRKEMAMDDLDDEPGRQMACLICENLDTGGTYETCSYESEPKKNSYLYGNAASYSKGRSARSPYNKYRFKRDTTDANVPSFSGTSSAAKPAPGVGRTSQRALLTESAAGAANVSATAANKDTAAAPVTKFAAGVGGILAAARSTSTARPISSALPPFATTSVNTTVPVANSIAAPTQTNRTQSRSRLTRRSSNNSKKGNEEEDEDNTGSYSAEPADFGAENFAYEDDDDHEDLQDDVDDSDDLEEFKPQPPAYANEQSCKKVIRGDATCMVCQNPETNGKYEQCSYADEPDDAYEYAQSSSYGRKNKDSPKDRFRRSKPYNSTATSNIVVNSNSTGFIVANTTALGNSAPIPTMANENSTRATNKTDSKPVAEDLWKDLRDIERRKIKHINEIFKSLVRTKKEQPNSRFLADLEDDSYEKKFLNLFPDIGFGGTEADESMLKELSTKPIFGEDDSIPGFKSKTKHPSYFKRLPKKSRFLDDEDDGADGELSKMMREFKTKDRSKCAKKMKNKMTCYVCNDKDGLKREECMYVVEDQPKKASFHQLKDPNEGDDIGGGDLSARTSKREIPAAEATRLRYRFVPPGEMQPASQTVVHQTIEARKYASPVAAPSNPSYSNVQIRSEKTYSLRGLPRKFEMAPPALHERRRRRRRMPGLPEPQAHPSSHHMKRFKRGRSHAPGDDEEADTTKPHAEDPEETGEFKDVDVELEADPSSPNGAFGEDTEVVYDAELKTSLPKFMVEKSEHEAIVDDFMSQI